MSGSLSGTEHRVSLTGEYLGRPVPGASTWTVHAVTRRRVQQGDESATCAASGETVSLSEEHVYLVARRETDGEVDERTYILKSERALDRWFSR